MVYVPTTPLLRRATASQGGRTMERIEFAGRRSWEYATVPPRAVHAAVGRVRSRRRSAHRRDDPTTCRSAARTQEAHGYTHGRSANHRRNVRGHGEPSLGADSKPHDRLACARRPHDVQGLTVDPAHDRDLNHVRSPRDAPSRMSPLNTPLDLHSHRGVCDLHGCSARAASPVSTRDAPLRLHLRGVCEPNGRTIGDASASVFPVKSTRDGQDLDLKGHRLSGEEDDDARPAVTSTPPDTRSVPQDLDELHRRHRKKRLRQVASPRVSVNIPFKNSRFVQGVSQVGVALYCMLTGAAAIVS
mmetsp:Transcript_32392/g.86921  ORF Transcript_32392/g.86921 Transcript_32392/m.86921 type:complete len:301 (-) Transcript_32392:1566-2468(-)